MNPTVRWPDTTIATSIYCAPGVLTGLEIAAADGLMAMPRIGLGIGGLLLGRRGTDCVEILRSVPIACSHAMGPSFVLTPEEIAAASSLPADEVVGWYCSKTREPLALTEPDRLLFDTLCPESWQLTLLIWPSKGKATKAAFGFRADNPEGTFQLGEWMDLAWQDLAEYQPAPPGLPQAPALESAPEPTPEREVPAAAVPTAKSDSPLLEPVSMPRRGTLFGTVDPEPEAKRRRWPLRVLIAIIVPGISAAAAFFSRSYWMPNPPVALIASSDWAARVAILWNADALREQDRATLVIDDGAGPLHTIHLNQAEMRAGWSQYDCRPGKVTVTLLAGNLSDSLTLQARSVSYLPESGISK